MHLKLVNVGQICEADICFGDLTVLVGPQATGKSIALQFLKLMVDLGSVQAEMARYGIDWEGKLPEFFDAYFGEGMRSLWSNRNSEVWWKGIQIDLPSKIARKQKSKEESLFLIPAQRVLTMRDGWPRPFTDYSPGDPFAVREFSERLRGLVAREFNSSDKLFPQKGRLKKEFRELLEQQVFRGFKLSVDKIRSQKRLVLQASGGKETSESLPFMVWSAGQREFVPLLLGLYWLLPPSATACRGNVRWSVIEEPEMGLHPRAIALVLSMVLDLLGRGYKVCLSTHSPQVLELVWALQNLNDQGAQCNDYLDMFGAPHEQSLQAVIEKIKKKSFKVHYFDPGTGGTQDISELDPDAELNGDAGWGGLLEFSGRANAAVAHAVGNQ